MSERVRVVAAAHPLKARTIEFHVDPGATVEEILNQAQPRPELLVDARVWIGDREIPRERWASTRPKGGTQVTARVIPVPQGSIKKRIAPILTIAGAIIGGSIGGAVGAAIGGAIGGAAGAVLAPRPKPAPPPPPPPPTVGGMLGHASIAPIRPPVLPVRTGTDRRESPSFFIESARNTERPFQPVASILGRHRVVPALGARTFTEPLGGENNLRMLVVWGYGPLEISSIRIGETPLSQFRDFEIETREGWPDDAPVTLYTRQVDEQAFSILLKQSDSWTVRTTSPDADAISVDIAFPRGLVRFDDFGDRQSRSVRVEFQYRKVGDTTWLNPPTSAEFTGASGWRSTSGGTITSVNFSARRSTEMRHGLEWKVAERAQYEVRVRRTTSDSTSSRVFDDVVWVALRRITSEQPIGFDKPLAITALKIRSTDQLDRALDELNGICHSVVLDWDGAEWVERASNNPASLFRHVLQGPANARPLPDERIDLAGLVDWHEFCETQGLTCNLIQDVSDSVWDVLSDIAAAGRASPQVRDGLWGVAIDRPQAAPKTHVTPRNSWEFTAERAFLDQPHAWRIRFPNEDQDWRQDERIVYADGFSADNATRFEQIEFPGVTDPDQVWRLGRFMLAAARERPERWTFAQDVEATVLERGDWFKLTHDVLLVGLASGRVTEVITDTGGDALGVRVDEALPMEAGQQYGISIRTVGDAAITRQVVTEAGSHREVMFATPIPDAQAPARGDLFGFGLLGQETEDATVLSVEYEDELRARITAIPYRPAIYDADSGPIPPFVPVITPLPVVQAPVILEVRTDESVLFRGAGDTLEVRAAIRVKPPTVSPSVLEIQGHQSGLGDDWHSLRVTERSQTEVVVADVREGEDWDFRVRWQPQGRFPGPWAVVRNVRIIGKSTPPAALQGLTISAFGGQAFLRWDMPDELDVRFGGTVRFRFSAADTPTWGSSASIGEATPARSLFATLPLKPGMYFARVFDVAGNPGGIASVATKQATVLPFASADTLDEAPGFDGEWDGVGADGGVLRLVGVGEWDDIEDLDAVASVDMFGGAADEGWYDFFFGFDFEAVEQVRLTTRIGSIIDAVNDQIDNWSATIDEREDWDGTDQAQADARVYVRHTDDDPLNDPTWSEWQRLDSAEFEARAFAFRARLISDTGDYNILVSELGIDVAEVA